MSYIIYIVLNYLDSIDALVGKGGVSWTSVLIGSAVDIFVLACFFKWFLAEHKAQYIVCNINNNRRSNCHNNILHYS